MHEASLPSQRTRDTKNDTMKVAIDASNVDVPLYNEEHERSIGHYSNYISYNDIVVAAVSQAAL